jgi:hypothetical protein
MDYRKSFIYQSIPEYRTYKNMYRAITNLLYMLKATYEE